jgi:hypothetical protein
MRKPSHYLVLATTVALLACTLVPTSVTRAGTLKDSDLALRIALAFPERKTSSYEAGRLLSYLSGQLQKEGWSTRTLPYTNVSRTVSHRDRSIVYERLSGENLLALESPSAKRVDYLIISPYDNLFADLAGDTLPPSATAVSTSLVLEMAHLLDRDSAEFGIAVVSGHCQNGAGMRALVEVLEKEGITAGAFVAIGDLQASDRLPLVAGPELPLSLVERVMEAAGSAGLSPFVATHWTQNLMGMRLAAGDAVAPEKALSGGYSTEHDALESLGLPVLTIGLPFSHPTLKLSSASTPMATLGEKVRATARALAGVLAEPLPPEGPTAKDMPVWTLLGETFHAPAQTMAGGGLVLAAVLAVITVMRLPKDFSPFALCAGTSAAAALSMLLHSVFSNRATVRYVSDILPGRSLALAFVIFLLLVLTAFLRLWSIRSRIHHIHEISKVGERLPEGKIVWGSACGLGVLSALIAGASYTGWEMLPSLLLGGIAHGIATLVLRPQGQARPPSPLTLWIARLLYLVPLVSVFWAGNPLSPLAQAAYRASWTGLNRGSMVSALSLGVVAASVLSTVKMPRPLPRKSFLLLSLCEIAALALIAVSGFFMLAPYSPAVPAWAVAEETYEYEAYLALGSPVPIGQVTLFHGASGEQEEHTSLSGLKRVPLPSGVNFGWAHPARTPLGKDEEEGQDGGVPAKRYLAGFDLKEPADFVSLTFYEPVSPRSRPYGFELRGLDTLLSSSPEALGGETVLSVPPGYTVSIIRWDTVRLSGSLSYSVRGPARVTQRLEAVYLDKSFAGIRPVTKGIRYYRFTSRANQYVD